MKMENITDKTFGVLEWDNQLNLYSTQVELSPIHQVQVNFHIESSVALERIRQVYEGIQAQESALRQATADALLVLHNDTWNEQEEINTQEFMRRMNLEAITFYEDGTSELFYNDGDLFWGHCIVLSLNNQGQFQDATIAG
jgi:hypothetical protein